MAENIFTSENVQKYHKSGVSTYIGERTTRNGEVAMQVKPNCFYMGSDAGYCHILADEFKPNTQYVVDVWIDTDDTINNGTYYNGGFYVRYSDGTAANVYTTHSNGWKHFRVITPADKSVSWLTVVYNYNLPVYYRWDSIIVPYGEQNITKQGQTIASHFTEGASACTFGKGGNIASSQIVEY